jgi:hypothetical protein
VTTPSRLCSLPKLKNAEVRRSEKSPRKMFCNFYQHFQLSSKFKSLASFLLSNPPPLRGAPRTANPAPTFFFLQRELFILVIAQENVSGFIECQWFGSISFYFLFFIFSSSSLTSSWSGDSVKSHKSKPRESLSRRHSTVLCVLSSRDTPGMIGGVCATVEDSCETFAHARCARSLFSDARVSVPVCVCVCVLMCTLPHLVLWPHPETPLPLILLLLRTHDHTACARAHEPPC